MSLLELDDVHVVYGKGATALTAVDGVSLTLDAGDALGIVGESGSGKSTLARAVVQIVPTSSGRILLDGVDVTNARGRRIRPVRDQVQMVFQDPFASLNPRQTVGATLQEAVWLRARRGGEAAGRGDVDRLLNLVTLDASAAHRYPHEMSGGQLQRVVIARALAAQPRVLILDEVTSALDVSVQAAILNLLRDLRTTLGLSYICISHDLSVVGYLCERAMVLYLGKPAEVAPCATLFSAPRHPYSRMLLDSIPQPHGELIRTVVTGDVPDPRRLPAGCRFHPRCPVGPRTDASRGVCTSVDPQLTGGPGAAAACHFPLVPLAGRR
jgi:oligopeptide/dipeptide ABC transporter ATP-binding protein